MAGGGASQLQRQGQGLVWLFIILACMHQICHAVGTERKVYRSIMKDYVKEIRPTRSADEPLTVKFGLAVLEVMNLDEETGQGIVRTWLKMSWKDDFLTWNTEKYSGVSKLEIPADNIWLPDIQMYNGIDEDVKQDERVVVYSSGTVVWVTPAVFTLTCKHEFRGNSWTCLFKFGSWVYDGYKVDLVPYEGSENGLEPVDIDMSDYVNSDSWMVLSHGGKREVKTYECCPEPYVSMNFVLKLRNKISSLLGRRK